MITKLNYVQDLNERKFLEDEISYHADALQKSLKEVQHHLSRAFFYLKELDVYNKKLNEKVL
jgi:predicted Zn-dependent protease